MNLRIPFFNKKTLVVKINLEISYDEILIAIMKERYQSPINGKWRLDRIRAIKFYRGQTGLGLAVCKKYIDNLVEKNNLEIETDFCETPSYLKGK
jgi:hypothetical protein